MKLGFKIVTDSKALWIQILRAKYEDPWVPSVGPLVHMIPGHMYLDLGSALSDMVLGIVLKTEGRCVALSWEVSKTPKRTGSPQTCRTVMIFVLVRLIGNVSLGLLFGLSGRIVISSYSKILPSCTQLVGNWACLYTDGSVIYESDSAAAGGTVRNRNGK
ncbi:hypothetical protein Goklo_007892 [Gossypium klotzschianum]|uniref:RNase H type-1 domain-containing protein n=1 Tax=Gossypium klotzschianum TaxID=34286 RepID=A0A7J8UY97_9ROSI|nr:hypothetical protein [Gossypium klotzschianum]